MVKVRVYREYEIDDSYWDKEFVNVNGLAADEALRMLSYDLEFCDIIADDFQVEVCNE